jgi:hypothetical protein
VLICLLPITRVLLPYPLTNLVAFFLLKSETGVLFAQWPRNDSHAHPPICSSHKNMIHSTLYIPMWRVVAQDDTPSGRNMQCILFVLGMNDKQHLLWLYVCILEGEPLVHVIAFRHSYWWKERKSLRLYDCLYVVNWLYDRSWLHGCFVLMFSVKRQIKRAWIISC